MPIFCLFFIRKPRGQEINLSCIPGFLIISTFSQIRHRNYGLEHLGAIYEDSKPIATNHLSVLCALGGKQLDFPYSPYAGETKG